MLTVHLICHSMLHLYRVEFNDRQNQNDRIILNDLRTETLSAAQTGKSTSDKMQLFTIPVTKYCSW